MTDQERFKALMRDFNLYAADLGGDHAPGETRLTLSPADESGSGPVFVFDANGKFVCCGRGD